MRVIKLTQGMLALVDDADFEWLNKWKWFARKSGNTFYAIRKHPRDSNGKQKEMIMHRAVLKLTDPDIKVDHKDHNGLNNQKSNLRAASTRDNCANSVKIKETSSKYRGVSWSASAKKWVGQIGGGGSKKHLGTFNDELEAALAYDREAAVFYGEFANLNFPINNVANRYREALERIEKLCLKDFEGLEQMQKDWRSVYLIARDALSNFSKQETEL